MGKIAGLLLQYKGLNRSAYVLFFGRLITKMGSFIFPLITLILNRKMGYSNLEVAKVLVVIGIIYMPATIMGGKLADRFNRKLLIVIFDTISVVFFISCAFVEPSIKMLVLFTIAGWFANMEAPVFESLLMDVTKPSEREQAFSLMYLGSNLGLVVGVFLGGLLFENFLSLAFVIDGTTTLLSTLLILLLVVEEKQEAAHEDEYTSSDDRDIHPFKMLVDRRSVLIQIVILFMVGFLYEQWTFALPLYMSHLFDAKGAMYFGFLSAFNAGVVLIMTPIMTKLTENVTEIPKVAIGVLMFSLSYVLILRGPVLLVFFLFMFSFTVGEILNMLGTSPFISRRIPGSHLGRINSYVFVCFFLGSMTGKWLVGLILEYYDYQQAFIFIMILGSMTALLSAYNYRVDKRRFPKFYRVKETGLQAQFDQD